MKTAIQLMTPLLLAFFGTAFASEVHVYKLELRGPAPKLEEFKAAIDQEKLPGLLSYSGAIDEKGSFQIDKTDHSIASPDQRTKNPRRLGVFVQGSIARPTGQTPERRVKLSFRECRHVAYLYASGEKRFVPSWTESSMEVLGDVNAEGWGMIDSAPDSPDTRWVFLVHVAG